MLSVSFSLFFPNRNSSVMLKRNGKNMGCSSVVHCKLSMHTKSGHLCHFPSITEKAFCFSPVFAAGISFKALIRLKMFPFTTFLMNILLLKS